MSTHDISKAGGGLPAAVCAVDEAYAKCAATMLRSLAFRLRRYPAADIYIFQDKLTASTRSKLMDSVESDRLIIHWVDIEARLVAGLKVDGHVSVATYYRLQMEHLLPLAKKVIYLDCDTVINHDLGILWDMPVNNIHLLAVPQILSSFKNRWFTAWVEVISIHWVHPDTPLFNAGVLVVNLELWRRDGVGQAVTDYLRRHAAEILWWDQDGLNAILAGLWRPLSYQWNVMTSLFRYYDTWRESPLSRTEYYETITDPYIIHFNSRLKPWHSDFNLPYKELFRHFMSETLWLMRCFQR